MFTDWLTILIIARESDECKAYGDYGVAGAFQGILQNTKDAGEYEP